MEEFKVDDDGLLSAQSSRGLAEWYRSLYNRGDVETFEVAISLVRTTSMMTSTADGPTKNVGRARYSVLRIIYHAENHRMQMGDIGEGLNVSPTNVTKIIDGLSEDGYVRRVRDGQDKRRTWAELTDDGVDLIEQVLPKMVDTTLYRWRMFSKDEKRLLAHLLAKLQMSILMDTATSASSDLLKSVALTPRVDGAE